MTRLEPTDPWPCSHCMDDVIGVIDIDTRLWTCARCLNSKIVEAM